MFPTSQSFPSNFPRPGPRLQFIFGIYSSNSQAAERPIPLARRVLQLDVNLAFNLAHQEL